MQLRPRLNNAKKAGFSLVELVITMTIMTILVGVVSLRSDSLTDKARVAKTVRLVENLKSAVMMYHQDTNQLPIEYRGYSGATYHRLTEDPGIAGWSGPYIESQISTKWNPTGAGVHLYNQAYHSVGNDWDLNGDGTADVGRYGGCVMSLWGIDEDLATRLNEAFDEGIPGNPWNTGRFEYRTGNSLATILVYHR